MRGDSDVLIDLGRKITWIAAVSRFSSMIEWPGMLLVIQLMIDSRHPTPDDRYPHPQDVANLILYLQTELALLQQRADEERISDTTKAHIIRCRKILRQSIDQMQLRDWYRELTYGMQDQIGRLDEWF